MEFSSPRFEIKKQLGEGSFSKIYEAWDSVLNQQVALKMEKLDKGHKILKLEYDILKHLQKVNSVPKIYDFVESCDSSFIVLECLGLSVSQYKKKYNCDSIECLDILIQMLDAIRQVHEEGYIHRDIKPTNFVMGQGKSNRLYIIDFGLGKLHLDRNGKPFADRKSGEFRGTPAYASLNAHNKCELSRRDDLWSFYFVIMDLLDYNLPWKNNSSNEPKDKIRDTKRLCLERPELLFIGSDYKVNDELMNIVKYLKSLQYESQPDYNYIKKNLEIMKFKHIPNGNISRLPILTTIDKNSQSIVNPFLIGQKRFRDGANILDSAHSNNLNNTQQTILHKNQEVNLQGLNLLLSLVNGSTTCSPTSDYYNETNLEVNNSPLKEVLRSQNRKVICDLFKKTMPNNVEKNLLFQILSNDKESLNNLINDLFEEDGFYNFMDVLNKDALDITHDRYFDSYGEHEEIIKKCSSTGGAFVNAKINSLDLILKSNTKGTKEACLAKEVERLDQVVKTTTRDIVILNNISNTRKKTIFRVDK